MNLPLSPQERAVIEEAFLPYIQAVTIIAKLRGLNPGTAQLSADRQFFIVQDAVPVESNGLQNYGD